MPTKEDLLLEKRRYGLVEVITKDEEEKLKQNMPIQLIMGYVNYYGVRINLNHKVLIPRYETEELVDLFLKKYARENTKILDLCCGSGFIGLAIKKHIPSVNITSSDIDIEAVKQTQENAILNFGLNHECKVIQSNMFEKINDTYDAILCNPPYLSKDDLSFNHEALKFEPEHALYAKNDGWKFYEILLKEYKKYLKPNGLLLLEINPLHINKWKAIEEATIIKDINKKDRFVVIKNN